MRTSNDSGTLLESFERSEWKKRRDGGDGQPSGALPDGWESEQSRLIRRGDNGRWNIPGGGKHWWESPARAARRELREETGLRVGPLTRLGVWRGPAHRHTYPDGNVVDWTTHVFVAVYVGGEVWAGDDAAQARWWPLAALPADVLGATAAYFAALGARA